MLTDPSVTDPSGVQRVVLLTGKLYYDLVKARSSRSEELAGKIAFVRVEELSPFPFRELKRVLEGFARAEEVLWVQEEPRNQGAWGFVEPRIRSVLDVLKRGSHLGEVEAVRYVGRKEAAVPAPGATKLYQAQQKGVVEAVFEGL